MLASSSLVSFIRDEREYAMMYVCCYERKVATMFHLPELSTYVRTPQRHIGLRVAKRIIIFDIASHFMHLVKAS